MINAQKQTDDPDNDKLDYSPRKAKKSKRDLEKQVMREKSNGAELSNSAETLKQKIAALKLQKSHQSEIINSKTSSSQEKRRAEEHLQAVKRELEVLEDKLHKLGGVSS